MVKELSKFILNLKYEDIPNEAIEKAKLCLLDFLGVTVRGSNEKSPQIAIKTLKQLYPNSFSKNSINNYNINCSIIGTKETDDHYSTLLNAGFINGISAHTLDLDDGHRIAQLHPGCVVFPTALAIAESNNLNRKDFLEAVICGYEIAIVLGKLVNPDHRNQGFHSTGTIGTFASGATVAKLLNFDLNQIIATLGLCGTQSSGLLESDHAGTMGKQLHGGKAVYNGILSAQLAKNGFTGAESIIDGDEGFLKAMAIFNCSNNNYEFKDKNYLIEYLANELGKFHIMDVYFKKYPFCRHLHSTIDSTLVLNKKLVEKAITIESIEKITIKTYKIASEHDNFNPIGKEGLKQSLPYAVAIAIVFGNVNLDTIKNIDFDNPKTKSKLDFILNKIAIEEDEELTSITPSYRPSKVIIEVANKNNKETFEDLTIISFGESEKPFSKEDILDKFIKLNPNFNISNLLKFESLENQNIREFIDLYLK